SMSSRSSRNARATSSSRSSKADSPRIAGRRGETRALATFIPDWSSSAAGVRLSASSIHVLAVVGADWRLTLEDPEGGVVAAEVGGAVGGGEAEAKFVCPPSGVGDRFHAGLDE